MLTAKKFAEGIGKPYSTVALWLKDERIPEAERHEMEGEKVFYLIPASLVEKYQKAENQPKRGRPKRVVSTPAATGEKPAKPAGKKSAKK